MYKNAREGERRKGPVSSGKATGCGREGGAAGGADLAEPEGVHFITFEDGNEELPTGYHVG